MCYNWYKRAVSTANVLYCVICLIYCKCICTVSVLTTSKLYLYIDLPRLVHYFQSMIIVYQLCKNRNYKMSQINWWSFFLPKSIYKFSLSVLVGGCLFVCFYRINVRTAEPIGPIFFVRSHLTPGKVMNDQNLKKCV